MTAKGPLRGNPAHPGFPHGTRTGYAYGCRDACPAAVTCRAAAAEYQRARRARRAANGGVARVSLCVDGRPHRCNKEHHRAENREYQREWKHRRSVSAWLGVEPRRGRPAGA